MIWSGDIVEDLGPIHILINNGGIIRAIRAWQNDNRAMARCYQQ